MVTGEPIPVEKAPGDKVVGGTVNGQGGLVMRAERVGQGTLLAPHRQPRQRRAAERAPIQRLADKVSSFFVPRVVAVALATFAVWWIWSPAARARERHRRAHHRVPLRARPATPMSIMVGAGRGAARACSSRTPRRSRRFSQIDTLVIDKTGTLTEGKPKVRTVSRATGARPSCSAKPRPRARERGTRSAAAIVAAARERGINPPKVEGFRAEIGKGVTGVVEGRRAALATRALADLGSTRPDLGERADALRPGRTVVFVAVDGERGGSSPSPIPSSPPLPGRSPRSARGHLDRHAHRRHRAPPPRSEGARPSIASSGGPPDQKSAAIERLEREGHLVAMAARHHDAPALARAQGRHRHGTGADVALESAGVTLVKGDLYGIVRARRLAGRRCATSVRTCFFAFIYNGVGCRSRGVLYPVLRPAPEPMIASAAMSLSSFSVIANALRLRRVKLSG